MRYMRSPRAGEGVGDEAVGGEVGPAVVAAGQLRARQVQLAGDTDRDRAQPGVEDVDAGCSTPVDRSGPWRDRRW